MITFERFLVLKSVEMFKDTPDDVLMQVAATLKEVRAPKGQTIIHKGELGTTMYVVVEGKLKTHDGDQVFVEIGAREVFGELSALSPTQRLASNTALEDSLLLSLEGEALYDLMSMHVGLARGIIQFLCYRVRQIAGQKQ